MNSFHLLVFKSPFSKGGLLKQLLVVPPFDKGGLGGIWIFGACAITEKSFGIHDMTRVRLDDKNVKPTGSEPGGAPGEGRPGLRPLPVNRV